MTNAGAGELALAVQSARGTPATASTQRTYVVSADVNPSFVLADNPEVRSGRAPGGPWQPVMALAADSILTVRPKVIGLLLYAALGAKSVAGASDPFTHTITLGSGVVPYLTAWRYFGEIENDRFSDVRIGKLVLSSSSGGTVRAVATLLGGGIAYRTAQETTVAVETADTFVHQHGSGALLVEGAAYSSIREWTLTIDTGVALEQSLAGAVARMNGLTKISLDITHIVPDAALWRRAIYGSSSPTNLAAPATTPLVLAGSPVGVQFMLTAATSPERSLKLAIPQVALGPVQGFAPEVRYGPVIARTHLLGYAPSAGAAITATLKNSQASY